jgi:hypothetical protein
MEPRVSKQGLGRIGSPSVWFGIWAALLVAGVACIVVSLVGDPNTTPGAQAQPPATMAASVPTLPGSGTQQGNGGVQRPVPIWLNAPKAAITGQIIPVGVDARGDMAAPEGANSDPVWSEAFWWQYGVMPGQIGNAVIAGHLDRKDGSPAIFWWLKNLAPGDSVYVRTALGATLHFVVAAVKTFANPTGDAADPVLQRIFGPAQTANLNLITCTGDWTGTEYNQKLVVFTTVAP